MAGVLVAMASAFLSFLLPDGWRWLFLLHFGRKHDRGQLIFPGPIAIGLGILARRLLRRYLQSGSRGRSSQP